MEIVMRGQLKAIAGFTTGSTVEMNEGRGRTRARTEASHAKSTYGR
jgi:hypothetical protein